MKINQSVLVNACIVRTNDLKHGDGRGPEVVRDGGVMGDGVFLFATDETTVIVLADEEVDEGEEMGAEMNEEENFAGILWEDGHGNPSPIKRSRRLMDSGTSNVSTAVPVIGVTKGMTGTICGIFFPDFDFIIDKSNAEDVTSSSASILADLRVNSWCDVLVKESKPSQYR